MAMTLKALERILWSEVDNLHLRVDLLSPRLDSIEERLSGVERQVSLLWMSMDEVKTDVAYLRQHMATKQDLRRYATKDDFNALQDQVTLLTQQMATVLELLRSGPPGPPGPWQQGAHATG